MKKMKNEAKNEKKYRNKALKMSVSFMKNELKILKRGEICVNHKIYLLDLSIVNVENQHCPYATHKY